MIRIQPFVPSQEAAVLSLITTIQQKEYHLPITAEDQPDLRSIPTSYQVNGGQFWVATDEQQVVGTVGLVRLADQQAALKKLFVLQTARQHKVGQQLWQTVLHYCQEQKIKTVWLGTTEQFTAAHAFYRKQGFVSVDPIFLPKDFQRMEVDSRFFKFAVEN